MAGDRDVGRRARGSRDPERGDREERLDRISAKRPKLDVRAR
jgi:hypothetical protein